MMESYHHERSNDVQPSTQARKGIFQGGQIEKPRCAPVAAGEQYQKNPPAMVGALDFMDIEQGFVYGVQHLAINEVMKETKTEKGVSNGAKKRRARSSGN